MATLAPVTVEVHARVTELIVGDRVFRLDDDDLDSDELTAEDKLSLVGGPDLENVGKPKKASARYVPQCVAVVHWDAEHDSPPIGPFAGVTRANEWRREFLRAWRVKNARKRTRRGEGEPRVKLSIFHTPETALGWVGNVTEGWSQLEQPE